MAEMPVRSEVAGVVLRVAVAAGARIAEGDEVAIVEAMKMELPVLSPAAGTVRAVLVKAGDQVAEGQALAMLSR